ncbi:PIM1 kinase, partial [Erythrocercus mccallii]|nr:PIM1 kinase [Erythrocercus mccallii]
PAGKVQEALQERHRLSSLLGPGGVGSGYSETCLEDGTPVVVGLAGGGASGGRGLAPNSTCRPLEMELLDKVSTGFHSVVQLLDWFELPDNLLVMERP